jgi:hypothetical protein
MKMRDYPTLPTWTQVNVKKHSSYCCSTFHSHGGVFINGHNSYPKLSAKRPIACSTPLSMNSTVGHLCHIDVI